MPKAKHNQYGEPKDSRLEIRISKTAREGLENLASSMNCSISEVIELLGRGRLLGESSPG